MRKLRLWVSVGGIVVNFGLLVIAPTPAYGALAGTCIAVWGLALVLL